MTEPTPPALEFEPSGPVLISRRRIAGIDGTEIIDEQAVSLTGVLSKPMRIDDLARVFGCCPRTMASRLPDLPHERFGERVRVKLDAMPPEFLARLLGKVRYGTESERNAACAREAGRENPSRSQ